MCVLTISRAEGGMDLYCEREKVRIHTYFLERGNGIMSMVK